MARWEKHGTTSNGTLTALHYLTWVFQFFGSLIYPVKALVEVVEFRVWTKTKFGKIKLFRNKRLLLDELLNQANQCFSKHGKSVFYVEFGVAFGETAEYLISRTISPFIYHGFDTFEGLPKAWRRLPAGAISNQGKIPNIVGETVFFYKGLIEETINQVDFKSSFMKIFIFDFDLYKPTLFALKHVFPEIVTGDIVYFDEAFDSDERVIIENYFIDQFEYSIVGASPFGLAFKILKTKV